MTENRETTRPAAPHAPERSPLRVVGPPNAAQGQPGAIPREIDARLRQIAEGCAGPDYRLNAIGWTRFEYVDAVHRRLREKWRNERAREMA